MAKQCKAGCGYTARPGERYCKVCASKVLRDMRKNGYLEPSPGIRTARGHDSRENQQETRHGVGS
jgi:hypothetical protein